MREGLRRCVCLSVREKLRVASRYPCMRVSENGAHCSESALPLPKIKPAHCSRIACAHQARLEIGGGLRNQTTQAQMTQLQKGHISRWLNSSEIIKRERASLRIGCAGNPDRQLLRLKLRQLRRRFRRYICFIDFNFFRLDAVFARGQATPARFAKKPKPIVRRFAFRRMRGRFANRILKGSLSFMLIAGHQETKPIQLRQILTWCAHADFRKSRKLTCLCICRQVASFTCASDAITSSLLAGDARPLPHSRGC